MKFIRRYRTLLISFALFTGLLSIFTFALYEQYVKGQAQNNNVIRRYENLRQARLVLTSLIDMETGVRGFMLSADRNFLEPYETGRERVDDAFIRLRALTTDENPESLTLVKNLGAQIERYKTLLSEQIRKANRTHNTYSTLTPQDMLEGKQTLDGERQTIESFLRDQNIKLATGIADWHDQQKRYSWFLFSGALAMLIALVASNYAMLGLGDRAQLSEEQLKHLEEGHRLLLTGMSDGTYDYQPSTGYMYMSKAHQSMLGYTAEDLPNRIETINNLMHPSDHAVTWDIANRYMRREIPEYSNTFRLRHKDGSWRWILSRGFAVWNDDGTVRRMVGIHTDITSQKAREEDLRELNSELESFTYIASHDLRGPLINIKGFAGEVDYALRQIQPQLDRCAANLTPPEQAEFNQALQTDVPEALSFIRAAVDKMDKLTTAILDLSRIGKRVYKYEKVDTAIVVQNCLKALAYEITQKNVQVECQNLPTVMTDDIALEQVLGNLIDNAIKFMSPERQGRLVIKSEMNLSDHVFTVADNGTGISELDKKKVFDIFRRGANAKDTRGIGMGMAYVKTTLRKLDGKVWFESTPGEGTTFYFTLPHGLSRRLNPNNDSITDLA